MELKIAFVGFGNAARAFARLLEQRQARLLNEYEMRWRTTAIATARHGSIMADEIDLADAAAIVESQGALGSLPGTVNVRDSYELIRRAEADILFETTPLNPIDGEPAITHIRKALERGVNVVTANKGPLAFGFGELNAIAKREGVAFRFEGTVMDGAPVFNLIETCLPAAVVLGFSGVLNSTTNYILTEMESGRSFQAALIEAQRLGITEANPDYDIDGWDAAVKTVVLANALMRADARPADVARSGIRQVTPDRLKEAARSGNVLRLVARAKRSGDRIRLSVAPEEVAAVSLYGSVCGTSSVLAIETDLMGELAIFETDPGIRQTAYALLSDMIRIYKAIVRS